MNSVVHDMTEINSMPATSRLWIYQSDQRIDDAVVDKVNAAIKQFARDWTSHNTQLTATGGLLHNRFLVLAVDESSSGASGCSIDSSVKFVRAVGEKLGVDFMDRLSFAYLDGDEVKTLHKDELPEAYEKGVVGDETPFFDNLIKDVGQLRSDWIKPLGDTWMKRFV